MKKILIVFLTTFFASAVFFVACNKQTTESIQRNDSTTEFGNFTPTVIYYSENNMRADFHFVETPTVFTIDLREKNSGNYIELIDKAIKAGTPVLVTAYANGMIGSKIEVANIKESSPEVIQKYKSEISLSKTIPLSKEGDIAPISSQQRMDSIFLLCMIDPDQSFAFKPDGCYARAHKMYAILAANGAACGKQFIYGNLAVQVSGSCCQNWSWHVAPLVRFRNSSGGIEVRIFDPSVASYPLTKAQWEALCTNPCTTGAGITSRFLAQPSVYNRNPTTGQVVYDNNLAKTMCTLNLYRPYSGGCVWPPAGACSW